MPVAEWIAALHADLDARIAAAEAKIAAKPAQTEAPETPKKKTPKKKETPDAPKKEPKPAKSDTEDKRIKRMTPTLSKQLTTVFQDAKKEFKKENGAEFAKYVNDLTKDAFEAKNLYDHMRDFAGVGAAPVAVAETKPVETKKAEPKKTVKKETPIPEAVPDEDLVEVTFKDVKYVVGEISKRVYEANDDGDKYVGLLGLGKFKTMQLPA